MTTPEPEVEMTIEQIVKVTRSKYFTAAFRLTVPVFLFLCSSGIAVIGWAVFDTRTKAEAAGTVADSVAATLVSRTRDNESFQGDVLEKVDDLHLDLDKVRSSQIALQVSVGRIEGILEQMQQQRSAPAAWLGAVAAPVSAVTARPDP